MKIIFEGITKTYLLGNSIEVKALRGINAAIESGEAVAVVGPSGAGKSTLLHLAGFMDRPSSGKILFDGVDIAAYNDSKICEMRRDHVGFIFQMHYLLPEFTVLENVLFPVWENKKNKIKYASELLSSLGLDGRLGHLPSELSGGEQQRVALARALVSSPSVILADEPTGNLDRETGSVVEDLMLSECKKRKATLIVVTHNPDLASKAGRIIKMRDGLIEN